MCKDPRNTPDVKKQRLVGWVQDITLFAFSCMLVIAMIAFAVVI